jgi:hypothetical protein
MAKEYILKIDAYTPTTIPMARLAEYMADLATMLGESKSVHFVRLANGSTKVAYRIEREAEPKVRERIRAVRSHDAPREAMTAWRAIDKKLAEDNATGAILDPKAAKLIEFPGEKRFTQPTYGPFNQPGEIDGIPIRVGGEDETVPVHLEEPGKVIHICLAKRDIARELGKHLFTTLIRAQGLGRWCREKDGQWTMLKFTIHSFRELERRPLGEALTRLRAVSGFDQIREPLAELERIRHGS